MRALPFLAPCDFSAWLRIKQKLQPRELDVIHWTFPSDLMPSPESAGIAVKQLNASYHAGAQFNCLCRRRELLLKVSSHPVAVRRLVQGITSCQCANSLNGLFGSVCDAQD